MTEGIIQIIFNKHTNKFINDSAINLHELYLELVEAIKEQVDIRNSIPVEVLIGDNK